MTRRLIERLTDAEQLAALHGRAFDQPWSVDSFADLLDGRGIAAWGHDDGFILVRRASMATNRGRAA